jgi:two-component system CheB/CheR fusion protein
MLLPGLPIRGAAPRRAPVQPTRTAKLPAAPPRERPTQEALARGLLDLPVGVVVVDRRYDIQTLNTAARRLLGLHGVAIGEDLIHLLRGVPAADLRAAIDLALRPAAPRSEDTSIAGPTSVAQILALEAPVDGPRYLQIACYPHSTKPSEPEAATQRDHETVLIMVIDVTASERERRAREEEWARAAAQHTQEIARLDARVRRLTTTNDELLVANQDLATANIELRSALEAAQLRVEETQTSAVEVEILNEELQASNEALETVNEELQATIEELNATNADRCARGGREQ